MTNDAKGAGHEPQTRPHRLNFAVYVLAIVLLYIGNLVLGVSVLFYGLGLSTPNVALSSILNWAGAWVLCYFAFKRSHTFGYVLLAFTVVLTVLTIAAVIFVAFFMALTNPFTH